jgi:hypothetical protein
MSIFFDYVNSNISGTVGRVLINGSDAFRLSNIIYFTSNDTWNKPSGLRAIMVEVVGGGGGGGGCAATGSGQSAEGGGGGGGGYSKKFILENVLGSSEPVTVGIGGDGGSTGNNPGSAGGASSFGSHLSATGGEGAPGGAATSTFGTGGSGGGGVGSGGDINLNGQRGGYGTVRGNSAGTTGVRMRWNFGGGTVLTPCRYILDSAGLTGNFPGGGASGSSLFVNSSAIPGASGSDGIVIVKEYV